MPRPRCCHGLLSGVLGLLMLGMSAAPGQHRPHAGMMRYPDVSAESIVFSYADDLWLVAREGGIAVPLASPPGNESFPRFSPDGRTVAFIGNYDGGRDIYTVPVGGGVPVRVTHHPAGEILCNWTPDGNLLFAASGYVEIDRQMQLFTVAAEGGLPEQLPVPYGVFGDISPDGIWLAYTPYTRDFATWKRYRGGQASDIWLFHLSAHTSKRITNWEGTDSQPMWHGDKLFYVSDAGPAHRLNIWVCDPRTGAHEQLTQFRDWDVKWPALGPGASGGGEIVFQNGADLYLLDLPTRKTRIVEITVPGDRPKIRPQRIEVQNRITNFDVSATGQRAALEARGDIWTVPARRGSPRNLTRTSGVAERDPSWSPDGRWVAYFSDESGEYELYLTQSDGKGKTRQLTDGNQTYWYGLAWSPDSKRLALVDKGANLYLHTLAPLEAPSPPASDDEKADPNAGKTILIDTDPWGRPPQLSWSHDSNWIAYMKSGDNMQSSIRLYSIPTGEKHQVTTGVFNDSWPTFDREGKYLFFATNRVFSGPIYSEVDNTWIYGDTDLLAVVPLRADIASPWAPKSDEEEWGKKDKKRDKEKDKKKEGDDEDKKPDKPEPGDEEPDDRDGAPPAAQGAPEEKPSDAEQSDEEKPEGQKKEDDDKEAKKDKKKPLEIDLENFEQRAIQVPVSRGSFWNLAVNDKGQLLYVRGAGRRRGGNAEIKLFDLADEEKEEKSVLEDVGGFRLSSDGKKLLVRKGGTFAVVESKPKQKLDKPMSLDGLAALIDPREEWRQVFVDAWRIERDFFYVDNMHGVDWEGVRDHYLKMLDDCVSRSDVGYVIREMISELNIGHAYYNGRDNDEEDFVQTGMLDADFELADGAYRIQRIFAGAPWDLDARGPLSQPGVKVRAGDYLLAINGLPLDTAQDPWAALQGLKPGAVVSLTVSAKAVLEPPSTQPAEDAAKPAPASAPADDQEKKDPYAGQREVLVELASPGRISDLRYRDWVERKRAYVEQHSEGKVGYIHVPDTGVNGQNELVRQFFGQRHKDALIIDDRWNGGGQIPNRFIELLNRPVTNYWKRRHGRDEPEPEHAHHGPKCMLINGAAGSGGDMFPFLFRAAGLGKLIGTRTWGGLVGISGNPQLIDGAGVTVPTFGFYETDGTWGIEGHGVDPDIEVIDDPALMVDGTDPQLDAAIDLMLTEVARNPYVPPATPAPPDRSGMGIAEPDK